jgi:hypothetical protein
VRTLAALVPLVLIGCVTPLPPPEKASPPAHADLGPLVPLGVLADRVALKDHPVQPDGDPDFAFRVRVSGDVEALLLMSSDPAGKFRGLELWDTLTAPTEFPKAWQLPWAKADFTAALAVYDASGKLLNPATTLARTRFDDETLTLFAEDPSHTRFVPGRTYTLMVVRPGGRIDRATTTLL